MLLGITITVNAPLIPRKDIQHLESICFSNTVL